MKNFLTSSLLLVGFSMFAQIAQPNNSTQTTPAQTSISSNNPKAKALCATWYLTQTENFGDVHKPSDQQKGDLLFLFDAGQYRFIYNGVAESGSWTLDKGGVWITLTTQGGATKKLNVIESTATTLKVDYKDGDDIHNILYYSTTVPGK